MGGVILWFNFKFSGSLQDAYFSLQCFPILNFYCMHATFYSERAKVRVEEYNIPKLKSSERKSTSLLNIYPCVQYIICLSTDVQGESWYCCQTCLSYPVIPKSDCFCSSANCLIKYCRMHLWGQVFSKPKFSYSVYSLSLLKIHCYFSYSLCLVSAWFLIFLKFILKRKISWDDWTE